MVRKIVVIIPARYESSRFEGKPLAKIAGRMMIERVYRRAALADRIDDVVVATDDDRIEKAVLSFDGKAVMTSLECRSGTDRVAEAGRKLGLSGQDIVINVQGDQPLLDPVCLDEVVTPLLEDTGLGMSTLAFKIVDLQEITNPKDVKVVFDRDGFALYFSRSPIPVSRDDDVVFDTYKHLGIYAYTVDFLEIFRKLPEGALEKIEKLEQLRALENGHRLKVIVTGHDSPEVDLPADVPRIETMLSAIR